MLGVVVSWKSFTQTITANSITKVEYIAASEIAKETVWIRKFINNFSVVLDNHNPIVIYCWPITHKLWNKGLCIDPNIYLSDIT